MNYFFLSLTKCLLINGFELGSYVILKQVDVNLNTVRLILAFIIIQIAAMPTALEAALPQFTSPGDCHIALDNSRTLYSEGDKKAASTLLNHMQAYCTGFAQIEHNLGVLAASNQQYDVAVDHFQSKDAGLITSKMPK